MRYKNEISDYIINNVNIVILIQNYVNLKKSGRNYMGLCPFHSEKTASFVVSEEKQFFHCFGCKEAGNSISFIMKYQNLNFIDAIEEISKIFNLDISQFIISGNYQNKNNLYDIMKETAKFYYENLKKSQLAFNYLKNRDLEIKTIVKFGLGYSNDSINSLYLHLKKKGFNEEDMLLCNIVGRSKSGLYYDMFKNRIMFPIFDSRGRVIAFGGRSIDDTMPKYLNSREGVLFDKSNILYGLNFVLKDRLEDKTLILVEGYIDVITLSQYGYNNVVASLGTALTQKHVENIEKYFEKVIFSFDGDNAGRNAIFRSLELFKNSKLKVTILELGKYKDPDEFIKNNGKEKFDIALKNSLDEVDFKINYLKSQYDINNNQEKLKFIQKSYEYISTLSTEVEQDIYLRRLADLTFLGYEAIKNDFTVKKNNLNFSKKNNKNILIEEKKDIDELNLKASDLDVENKYSEINLLEDRILSYFLKNINEIGNIVYRIKGTFLTNEYNKLYDIIYEYSLKNERFSLENIIYNYDLDIADKLNKLYNLDYNDDIDILILEHKKFLLIIDIKNIDEEMRIAKLSLDENAKIKYRENINKRMEYTKELGRLKEKLNSLRY